MKRFLALLGTVSSLLMVSLSADARDPAAKDLTQKQIDKLQSTVMNMNLPLQKRIRALKKLHWDQLDGGKINRSFCVWDPLGRNGPIYATVDDQKLRSLHYGLALDIRAYQDEDELWSFLVYGEIEGWRILLIDSGKNHNQQRMIRHDPVYPESAFTTRRTGNRSADRVVTQRCTRVDRTSR